MVNVTPGGNTGNSGNGTGSIVHFEQKNRINDNLIIEDHDGLVSKFYLDSNPLNVEIQCDESGEVVRFTFDYSGLIFNIDANNSNQVMSVPQLAEDLADLFEGGQTMALEMLVNDISFGFEMEMYDAGCETLGARTLQAFFAFFETQGTGSETKLFHQTVEVRRMLHLSAAMKAGQCFEPQ